MAPSAAAQQTEAKSYALLEADRFPFSLPESCAPRLGVTVAIESGSLVFRTSSLPPNDLATVEAVENCLRDLRPNAQNPRVTYFGSLRAARDKWAQGSRTHAAGSPTAFSAVPGQPLFAITRAGTRLAIEGYAIEGDRIRLRLIGGGTLEWAKEEIPRIERGDGTQIEPPPAPTPAGPPSGEAASTAHPVHGERSLPGEPPPRGGEAQRVVPATTPAPQPSGTSTPRAKKTPPKVNLRPKAGEKAADSRSGAGAPTLSGRARILPGLAEGCCVLQLGSFRIRANAERLAGELAPRYASVQIVSGVSARSELVYRVRIPVSGDRAEAEKLARQLRAQGYEVIIFTRR